MNSQVTNCTQQKEIPTLEPRNPVRVFTLTHVGVDVCSVSLVVQALFCAKSLPPRRAWFKAHLVPQRGGQDLSAASKSHLLLQRHKMYERNLCNWLNIFRVLAVFALQLESSCNNILSICENIWRLQQQNHPAQIPLLSSIDEHSNLWREHINFRVQINTASHCFVWLDRAERFVSDNKMEWLVHTTAEQRRPT
jgi:hypothetical protein